MITLPLKYTIKENKLKSMGYTFGRWTGNGKGSGESGWLWICQFGMGKISILGGISKENSEVIS